MKMYTPVIKQIVAGYVYSCLLRAGLGGGGGTGRVWANVDIPYLYAHDHTFVHEQWHKRSPDFMLRSPQSDVYTRIYVYVFAYRYVFVDRNVQYVSGMSIHRSRYTAIWEVS